MDRGFGSYYRGSNNQTNFRQRDERRYEDFYSDRDRRGGSSGAGGNYGNTRGNRNFGGNTGGDRGSARDQGFFGQQGNQNAGQNSVIAALQLQNQNLLNAYIRNQNRGNVFQNQRKGYQGSGGGGTGFRPGDKRRQETASGPSGFKRSKPISNNNRSSGPSPRRSTSSNTSTPRRKDPPKEEPKEEEFPDIPDDEVEVPDTLMDNVERLRQRKEVERNVADEDVDKLMVFCFNGKGYQCLTCGLLLSKDTAFRSHLMAKGHVMNVIDARSAKKYQETRDILDIDLSPDGWYEKSEKAKSIILKQAKLIMKIEMERKKRELENYNKDPRNFFSVNMASRKSATMKGDTVRITSIVESTIDVKEFSKDRFFGCEFVKSVASFQCRLCDMKIHNASEVIVHIDSRVHKNKYQLHLKRNPDYEKTQKEQNKELGTILQEHEGNPVLLSEATSCEDTEKEKTLLDELDSFLVRVPEILNPPEKEVAKEEEEEKEEAATDEKEPENEETKKTKADENTENNKEEEEAEETEQAVEESVPAEEMEQEVTADDGNTLTEEGDQETEKEGDAPYDPFNNTDGAEEAEEETPGKEEEEADTEIKDPLDSKPKKSILKKGASAKSRGGTAKRGTPKRTRGGKVTPSPRSRRKPVAAEETTEEPPEQEAGEDDGNFMDGFQVVDEVQEE